MTHLETANLDPIGETVPVPRYPRDAVDKRIVHIGVGGFHRSHQALYLDRLLAAGHADGWGITGIGLLSFDARMAAAMKAQDCLYTLVEKDPDGSATPRVIGSITEYLFAPEDADAVLDRLVDPATRIVSLTITESGYPINDSTQEFEPQDDQTRADLSGDGPRRSAFGFIVEALRRRRAAGTPPFTVMCCDNIQFNGHVAHAATLGFARATDPELASWIEREVAFPNAMVDRITPATTDEMREEVRDRFGIEDDIPVVSESFTQWVLEDHFPQGRPDFERAGAQLVADVEPYEMMKLRLLNASHQQLAYSGFLCGYDLVHEAVADPVIHGYLLDGYMRGEAVATLKPVPGVDLDAYCQELLRRYGNHAVRDTLARLAVDGSDRMSKFLFPVIADRIAAGQRSPVCAMICATWARFTEGADDQGRPTPISDKRAPELIPAAMADRDDPGSFLDQPIFGSLGQDAGFREDYVAACTLLGEVGATEAIRRAVR